MLAPLSSHTPVEEPAGKQFVRKPTRRQQAHIEPTGRNPKRYGTTATPTRIIQSGTLVHIRTVPYALLHRDLRENPSDVRLTEIKKAFMDRYNMSAAEWKADRTANAQVATAFWPLKRLAIAEVMHHAYLQTALNMHVRHHTPLRLPDLDEFVALTRGETRDIAAGWVT